MSLSVPGADPILFDLGTGLRYFGATHAADRPDRPFLGTCLLSHLHWDHIQGLPFFRPLLSEGSLIDVFAPRQVGELSAEEVFSATIKPPLFPVDLALLPGHLRFNEVLNSEFTLGPHDEISVMSRRIPHIGETVGYRVEWNGTSVVYISDHQMPCDGSMTATQGALDLCRDADLVIHDAQFTPEEFDGKCDWGHCTIDFAVWLAAEAGARRLALFHHDPSHDDRRLDELFAAAAEEGARRGVEVFGAREGQTVAVGA